MLECVNRGGRPGEEWHKARACPCPSLFPKSNQAFCGSPPPQTPHTRARTHLIAIFVQAWRIFYDDGFHSHGGQPGAGIHARDVAARGALDAVRAVGVPQLPPAPAARHMADAVGLRHGSRASDAMIEAGRQGAGQAGGGVARVCARGAAQLWGPSSVNEQQRPSGSCIRSTPRLATARTASPATSQDLPRPPARPARSVTCVALLMVPHSAQRTQL